MKKSLLIWIVLCVAACEQAPRNPLVLTSLPPIEPDYTYVSIPFGIAPLQFDWAGENEAEALYLKAEGKQNKVWQWFGKKGIRFGKNEWRSLLRANSGDSLRLTLCAKENGSWRQYRSFTWNISTDPIDPYIAYRLIAPGYERYSKMGIYQRRLSSFHQMPVFENTRIKSSCVNCHSANKGNTDYFSLHIRGANGGTFLKNEEKNLFLDTKTEKTLSACVYPYWHPDGRYIAYSNNLTEQMFPMDSTHLVEVYDIQSDVVVLDTQEGKLITSPLLQTDDLATFPAFSPDGRWLYFCMAAYQKMPQDYRQIRYNLCRIAFEPSTGRFGRKVDTLVNASAIGKSLSFPRPSYDGRFVVFTLFDYGTFPIWHREADLAILNLSTGEWEMMEALNSSNTESYHCWSTNSRWLMFSSRRDDGLYTRVYIAHVDENGKASKPFKLPQANPSLYEKESLQSFNIPEFLTAPVELDAESLARRAVGKSHTKLVTGF